MTRTIARREAAAFVREFHKPRWDSYSVEELLGLVADRMARVERAARAAERGRIRKAFRHEVLHSGVQWASVYTSTVMRCVRAPRKRGGGR